MNNFHKDNCWVNLFENYYKSYNSLGLIIDPEVLIPKYLKMLDSSKKIPDPSIEYIKNYKQITLDTEPDIKKIDMDEFIYNKYLEYFSDDKYKTKPRNFISSLYAGMFGVGFQLNKNRLEKINKKINDLIKNVKNQRDNFKISKFMSIQIEKKSPYLHLLSP